jgi:hypothetical protein
VELTAIQKIFTEANLYEHEVLQDIYAFIEKIDDMQVEDNEFGRDVELVLEPMLPYDGSESIRGYYFVDHSARCLFWLEDFDLSLGRQGGKIASTVDLSLGSLRC